MITQGQIKVCVRLKVEVG